MATAESSANKLKDETHAHNPGTKPKRNAGARVKLDVPGIEAVATADGSGGSGDEVKSADFASAAHSVDRRCRRLGYPGFVRQRRSGAEFMSVPTLMQNCSSLLGLLAAGGRLQARPPTAQQAALHRISRAQAAALGDDHLTASSGPRPVAARTGSSHRSWKSIFTRRSTSKPAAERPEPDEPDDVLRSGDLDELARCLHQLLEGIRHSTERLGSIAGVPASDTSRALAPAAAPPPPHLTRLQREVLYFQTRWPQAMEAIAARFTDSHRAAKRLADSALARARAEAGARARCVAKVASLEAELRRVRAELRRCERPSGKPGATAKLPATRSAPLQRSLQQQRGQDKSSEASAVTTLAAGTTEEFDA